MDATNGFAAGQIGNRAGDAKDAGIAPRGQAHRLGGLREQSPPGLVRRCDRIQQCTIRLCIGASRVVAVAIGLDRARGSNPDRDLRRALCRRREDQVGGADRLHVDMEVDSIEQRTGDLRLIVRRTLRCSRTRQARIVEMCGKLPFRCTKRQSRLINDAHSAALYRTFRCTASALRSGGLR